MGRKRITHITPRDREVLQYIKKGLTNKEIAAKMFIAHTSVQQQRVRIKKKLKLDNDVTLFQYMTTKCCPHCGGDLLT